RRDTDGGSRPRHRAADARAGRESRQSRRRLDRREGRRCATLRNLTRMKVRDILRLIHEDGWFLVATRGSHRQFKHATKPGRVTVAGKPGDDLAPGTLNSILKQSGLRR